MTIKESLDLLGSLYSITGHDWELRIHHCLTEPTCPTICIQPEGISIARYHVHADSIEQGIEMAAAAVHRELIERKKVGYGSPYSNPADKKYEAWIDKWTAGVDEPFPDFSEELRAHYRIK